MSASQTHYDGQFTGKNFKLINTSEPDTTFVNDFFGREGAGVRNTIPHFGLEIHVYAFKDVDSSCLVMAKAGPLAALGITACF